jgi:hypothetical protein
MISAWYNLGWKLWLWPLVLTLLYSVSRFIFHLTTSSHSHLWSELLPWGLNTASTWSFIWRLLLSMTFHTLLFICYFLASINHSWEQRHLSTWWNLNIWSDFFSTRADHYEQFRLWVGQRRILGSEEFNLLSNLRTTAES